MSLLATIATAEGAAHVVNELPISTVAYGVIVFSIFLVLALVTYSFHDVANRHAAKAEAYARDHGLTNQHGAADKH